MTEFSLPGVPKFNMYVYIYIYINSQLFSPTSDYDGNLTQRFDTK